MQQTFLCFSGLDITACKEHIRQLQARRERRTLENSPQALHPATASWSPFVSDLIEKEEIRKGVTHDAAPRPGRISRIYFKIFQGFSMYVHTHIFYNTYIYILYQTLACLSACFCQFIRIESLSPKHSPIHSPIHSPMHSPDWCNWCWYSISQ